MKEKVVLQYQSLMKSYNQNAQKTKLSDTLKQRFSKNAHNYSQHMVSYKF